VSRAPSASRLPSTRAQRWLRALKPASWPKLLVPMWLGQVLGAVAAGRFRADAFLFGLAFTVSGLAFIVLTNDWSDQEVDAIKRKMFPEAGSPKTIPDGILPASAVIRVGLGFAVLAALSALGAQILLPSPWAFALGLGCVAIFAGYSLPPLRLNYRGGGELLEMAGVGLALPLYNARLQGAHWSQIAWPWLLGFSFLALASAIASGLSDEQSDRVGGKRTWTSMCGNRRARRSSETLVLLGGACWLLAPFFSPELAPRWVVLVAVGVLLVYFVQMARLSQSAETNAFVAQGRYKACLHKAIWRSTTLAAVLLWIALIVE